MQLAAKLHICVTCRCRRCDDVAVVTFGECAALDVADVKNHSRYGRCVTFAHLLRGRFRTCMSTAFGPTYYQFELVGPTDAN